MHLMHGVQTLQGWADLFPVGALFLMGASMPGAGGLADDRTYLFMVGAEPLLASSIDNQASRESGMLL